MFTLRATGKLLKRLKVRPNPSPPRPTTALGDWYANLLYVDRQQLVLCVSEVTLLPVLLRARGDEPLGARLAGAVSEMLSALGVPDDAVRREISEMNDVTVAVTANRAVLGSMNDFTNMIHAYWGPNATLRDIALKAAEAPCGPLDMTTPIDATVDLLGREHRRGAV